MSTTRLVVDRSSHRVAPLELFFDLVFVYGISQVTAYLAYDHSAVGFLRGLLLAGLLWWAWVAYSWLGTSVRVGNGWVQTSLFVAMAALMVLAVLMPAFFDEQRGASLAMVAAAAYVVVRLMHIIVFAIAGRDDPGIRQAVARLAWTVVLAAILLIVGAYLGGAWQMGMVCVALGIDLVGPFLGGGRGWQLALGHFSERHSLIVIIALGESIVAIGLGAADVPAGPALLVMVGLGVAVACALWVSYFDGSAEAVEHAIDARTGLDQVTTARDVYSYLHFLLVSGLILIALAMKSGLKGTHDGLSAPLAGYASVALGAGLFLFLGGLGLIRRRAGTATNFPEMLVAVIALALIPLGPVIPAIMSVAVACGVAIGWRTVRRA
ncbi:MAG: low temperature requirement protein A [Candidatus Nanopelagicales bacterium]